MARVDQSPLAQAEIRNKPITPELAQLLLTAAERTGVATVSVFSGGQPGTTGKSTGSTRHNGGRAADVKLLDVAGRPYTFTDEVAPQIVKDFVTECASLGAIGIGAGVHYMGNASLHIGGGVDANDTNKLTWGEGGKSVNAPMWLREAATKGWAFRPTAPVPRPRPAPVTVAPTPPDKGNAGPVVVATGAAAVVGIGATIWNYLGWIGLGSVLIVLAIAAFFIIRAVRKAGGPHVR